MLEEIVPIFKNFRDSVYRFFSSRRDAAMELVDALSSNKTASSIVALSLSPLHRRNYCSITRVFQVQNDFERIIRMIGTPAQPPKPRQKALGRQLGDIQIKRIRHPIVKKCKNTAATEKMMA